MQWLIPSAADRVLDLGAGTGKLTRIIAGLVPEVVAVEPLERMRAVLTAVLPGVTALDGEAERIPVPAASVDAVLVAQAWHWFEPSRAVPEVARVLKRGGTLGLLWNVRDDREPWAAELGRIIEEHPEQPMPGRPGDMNGVPVVGAPFGAPERLDVRWTSSLTREQVVALVESRSYFIGLDDAGKRRMRGGVEDLVRTHPDLAGRDRIELPYVCQCWRYRIDRD